MQGGINKGKDRKAREIPLCSEIQKTLVLLKIRMKGSGGESVKGEERNNDEIMMGLGFFAKKFILFLKAMDREN